MIPHLSFVRVRRAPGFRVPHAAAALAGLLLLSLATPSPARADWTRYFTLVVSGCGSAVATPAGTEYPLFTEVTLQATPLPGWHFLGWDGDTSTTANPIVVVVTRDRYINAIFEQDLTYHTLSVSHTGAGATSVDPVASQYPSGTLVDLSAQPDPGATFMGWNGDTTATSSLFQVRLDRDLTVQAHFSAPGQTVHPLATPVVGAGTIARSPALGRYLPGSVVALTAQPSPGWSFVGWSGDASGATNPVNVTMNGSRSVTATFTRIGFTLTHGQSGVGLVTRDPDKPFYADGEPVTVTATPGAGHTFGGWSGDLTSALNPLALTMTRDWSVHATFTPDIHPVDLTTVGNGSVVRVPGGSSLAHGSPLILTAVPAVGHTFLGWAGDTATTANPLLLTVTRPRALTARFTYGLTASALGLGTVARSPDGSTFTPGELVTLTATPEPGHAFLGWTGDTAVGSPNLTLTMDRNWSVVARFTAPSYPLPITVFGSGTVTRSPNLAEYAHGTSVTLTANPGPGSSFIGWSGEVAASTSPSIVVLMDRHRSITASFTVPVVVSTIGNGTVGVTPLPSPYAPGTVVSMLATPLFGHAFVGWGGDTTATSNPLVITATRARSIVGRFTLNLNLTMNGIGTINKTPNKTLYHPGDAVTLTAVPSPTTAFTQWSGDTSTTTNPLPLVMTRNRAIVANFVDISHPLTTTVDGSGSITRSPNAASHAPGTVVTLTAVPAAGQTFLGWSGDTTETANPLTVVMTRPRSITARFTYAMNVTIAGLGSVARSPDQVAFVPGEIVTLTATPNPGNVFHGWSGDTSSSATSITLAMSRPRAITANFGPILHALLTLVDGEGTVSRSPNLVSYPEGTEVALTAVPRPGHTFLGWEGDTTASAGPLPLFVTMNRPLTIRARFTYAVNLTIVGSGAVAKDPDQIAYVSGDVVTLTATPQSGGAFIAWSGDTSATTNPLTVPVNRTRTIVASFVQLGHALNVTADGNGLVARSPNLGVYVGGTPVSVTAIPQPGHTFLGWSGDTTATTNPLPLVMTRDRSLIARFTYQLSVNSIGSGFVPLSKIIYQPLELVTLNATPLGGNQFVGWSGDTTTTTNPLTLRMLGPRTLTATFASGTIPLTVTTSGSGTVTRSPNAALYLPGTPVTLTAITGAGNVFVRWEGDTSTTTPVITLAMNGPRSVHAVFTWKVDVTTLGIGSVVQTPPGSQFEPGTVLSLQANAGPGHAFDRWSGSVNSTANPLTVTMNQNHSLIARFIGATYTLGHYVSGCGEVTRSPGGASHSPGAVVTLTATALTGWRFVGWIETGPLLTENPLTVTMDRNRFVYAYFEEILPFFTVSTAAIGPGTIESNVPLGAPIPSGTVLELRAVPERGAIFLGWDGGVVSPAAQLEFPVYLDTVLGAHFAPPGVPTVPLATEVSGGGRIECSPQLQEYPTHMVTTLTARPDEGWIFAGWSGDATGHVDHVQMPMTQPREVRAVFKPMPKRAVVVDESASAASLPDRFALAAPSPNPGAEARLRFDVPRETDVRVRVMDVQGREVRVLASGRIAAGRHEARWAGDDARARPVAPGLYLIRFDAAGQTFVRRFALVR